MAPDIQKQHINGRVIKACDGPLSKAIYGKRSWASPTCLDAIPGEGETVN